MEDTGKQQERVIKGVIEGAVREVGGEPGKHKVSEARVGREFS